MTLLKKILYNAAVVILVSSAAIFSLMRINVFSSYADVSYSDSLKSGAAVVVCLILSTALLYFTMLIRRGIIIPLNSITKTAEYIGKSSDFKLRFPVVGDGEINKLALSLNAVMDRFSVSNSLLEEKIENNSIMLERSIRERISELMTMNQVLTLMEQVFEHSLDGIVITDADAVITNVNPAFIRITGYQSFEVLGKKPDMFKSDHHNAHFFNSIIDCLNTDGHWAGEIWNRHRDGNAFPEWLSITALKNSLGETTHYVGVFHDISDKIRQEELLRYQAFHDSLTGLPNLFLLKNRIEQSINHSNRDKNSFGIIFLDIDNFKKINDSLGPAIGDLLLKDTAMRLKNVVRNVDTLARYGGDEFIILVESIDDEKPVIVLAQRILATFKEPFKILDHAFYIGISMGIAMFPEDGDNYDILIRNADTAMYRAKENGKETFAMYTVSLNERVAKNLNLENSLRKALMEKKFEVHYQPQLDMKTGKITGVEGLARMNNPDGSIIKPDSFIPFSEENGFIYDIDMVIMEKAFSDMRELFNSGFTSIKLALNCSAKALQIKTLPDTILEYLSLYNLEPDCLELEITETSLMKNFKESLDVILSLRRSGISISLDDFGTGYSSLSQLKNLPIDKLKIDRCFIREMTRNRNDSDIIKAVIELSQKFGVKVIAEGVENEEQLEYLRGVGCDIVQGYFISRPLCYDDLKAFLGQWLLIAEMN